MYSTLRRLAFVLLGVVPGALSAQSVVQTLTFGSEDFSVSSANGSAYTPTFSGTINQFDATLGTLDSIALDFSFTYVGSVQLGAGGGGVSISGSGSAYWDTISLGGGSNGSGGGGGPFTLVPLSLTVGKNYETGALTFEQATGTGTATFSLAATLTAPVGAEVHLDSGTLSLTYNYTPAAIPEPSTYVVWIGLAAMAVAILRRRTVIAA